LVRGLLATRHVLDFQASEDEYRSDQHHRATPRQEESHCWPATRTSNPLSKP
jgi:hypothetical protein